MPVSHSDTEMPSGSSQSVYNSSTPIVSIALQESETSSSITHGSATLPSLDQSSLLPVHHLAQLQVLLLISSSPILPTNVSSNNSMIQTRLKTGAISRQDYSAYLASFLEFKSLQMDLESCSFAGYSFLAQVTDIDEPKNFKIASTDSYWQQTMQEEHDALQSQRTWILVPSPANRSVVGCKWVYKLKKNPDGSIARYKARLVAQGFTQEHGIDYSKTFSLVVRHSGEAYSSLTHKWKLRQLGIKNAFLRGDLQEEVYMQQPKGFVSSENPVYVCRLV